MLSHQTMDGSRQGLSDFTLLEVIKSSIVHEAGRGARRLQMCGASVWNARDRRVCNIEANPHGAVRPSVEARLSSTPTVRAGREPGAQVEASGEEAGRREASCSGIGIAIL